jgi:hypothetical protein
LSRNVLAHWMEECTQFHHFVRGVRRTSACRGRTNRSSEPVYFTLHVTARTPATVQIEG